MVSIGCWKWGFSISMLCRIYFSYHLHCCNSERQLPLSFAFLSACHVDFDSKSNTTHLTERPWISLGPLGFGRSRNKCGVNDYEYDWQTDIQRDIWSDKQTNSPWTRTWTFRYTHKQITRWTEMTQRYTEEMLEIRLSAVDDLSSDKGKFMRRNDKSSIFSPATDHFQQR